MSSQMFHSSKIQTEFLVLNICEEVLGSFLKFVYHRKKALVSDYFLSQGIDRNNLYPQISK